MPLPISLSFRLDFARPSSNPNAFYLPVPSAEVAEGGDFVGDTRRGGSCNCETVRLNPHGNGTHTECVGHLSTNRIYIADVLTDVLIDALLVTVDPTPTPDGTRRITRDSLSAAIDSVSASPHSKIENRKSNFPPPGLILRTQPDDLDTSDRVWSGSSPPFIDPDAMRLIRSLGVRHLLVDLPSVDPEEDDLLTSHRIFWELPAEGPVEGDPTDGRTITEMIRVPSDLADRLYTITIQVPPFALDAAPSRVLVVG